MEAVHRELQDAAAEQQGFPTQMDSEPESGGSLSTIPPRPRKGDWPDDPDGYTKAANAWYNKHVRKRPTAEQRREDRQAAWQSPGVPGSAKHRAQLAKDAGRKRKAYWQWEMELGREEPFQATGLPTRKGIRVPLIGSEAADQLPVGCHVKGGSPWKVSNPPQAVDPAPLVRTIMVHFGRRFACFALPGGTIEQLPFAPPVAPPPAPPPPSQRHTTWSGRPL